MMTTVAYNSRKAWAAAREAYAIHFLKKPWNTRMMQWPYSAWWLADAKVRLRCGHPAMQSAFAWHDYTDWLVWAPTRWMS